MYIYICVCVYLFVSIYGCDLTITVILCALEGAQPTKTEKFNLPYVHYFGFACISTKAVLISNISN